MKKALLIGSSFSAVPLFFALKKRGFMVTVCGAYKTDPLHKYADESLYVNYAKANELEEYLAEHVYDAIIPSCNDYGYLTAAYLANKNKGFLGFDSYNVTEIIHTKDMYREVCEKHSISAPRSFTYETLKSKTNLPCKIIVKPVDSFSGQGVSVVDSMEALNVAKDKAMSASRSGQVVFEEFVDGTLHSHSAFIKDRKISLEFFVDEYCTVYPYQVDCSCMTGLDNELKQRVSSEVQKLVNALGLVDGLLHTQFISSGKNIWLIESMRRCPGDLYGKLIEFSTGYDYSDLYVQAFIGEPDYSPMSHKQSRRYYTRHTISSSEQGCFFSYENQVPANNSSFVPLKSSGDWFDSAPKDKIGILFSEFSGEKEMRKYVPILKEYILINEYQS